MSKERDAILQGTLDLLILRMLLLGDQHGQGIGRAIQERSGDSIIVDHGSLYPALRRLEEGALIKGSWGVSENNRRARYYSLTAAGRRRVSADADRWNRLVDSIARVLGPELAGS
ncbi:MAG TPA: PadR family transcriptional regulator [Gemmatimonadales bacterium]|jgi:transcriptional regulator